MTAHETAVGVCCSTAARLVFSFVLSILLLLPFAGLCRPAGAQQSVASAVIVNGPLSTEQVVKNLVSMNRERAQALHAYRVTETFRLKYRGFPGSRTAVMVVDAKYHSPGTKQFTIQSATGSRLIINKVSRKLLEAEQQVLGAEATKRTALNTDNYSFAGAGHDDDLSSLAYVLRVNPLTKSKFLYHGRIWVNSNDFAVVRVEAEPAKNPSFWTRDVEIEQSYMKVGDFWLPARIHSITAVRLGGHAELTIQYSNYVITSADPVGSLASLEPAKTAEATQGQRRSLHAGSQNWGELPLSRVIAPIKGGTLVQRTSDVRQ
jgi:hypothetical protein